MLTLRLPIDDRHQGLAERPDSFLGCSEAKTETGLARLDPDTMARQLEIACRHGASIERMAARHGLLPSIIAGFCSRRSGFGLDLSPIGVDGTRDDRARPMPDGDRATPLPPDGLGFVRGLMGLDYDRHALARTSLWREPEANLEAACSLIAALRTTLRRRTTLQGTGLMRASLAAFECGLERVERAVRLGNDVDTPTFGRGPGGHAHGLGCGRDVMARAGFFQGEGWD